MTEFLQSYYEETVGGGQRAQAAEPPAYSTQPSQEVQSLDNLQQGMSVASSLFRLYGASRQARALERQAGDEIIAASAEETEGARRNAEILRRSQALDARMRAAFAASGVELGSGTVRQLADENQEAADRALETNANRTARRASARRIRAKMLARQAAENFGANVVSTAIDIGRAMAAGG